jgi:hypothetical protein
MSQRFHSDEVRKSLCVAFAPFAPFAVKDAAGGGFVFAVLELRLGESGIQQPTSSI